MDEGEALGDVGVVDAVAVEGPAGVRLGLGPAELEQLEAREIHAPDIAVARRHGPLPRQRPHAAPRESDLGRPAPVDLRGIVDRARHMHGGLHPREVPVHERPARPPRVLAVPRGVLEAAQHVDLPRQRIELRRVEPAAPLKGVLPDIKNLVDRAQGVDLELVVAVFAADEDLDVVLGPHERVALRQPGPDIGLLDPEAHIEIVVIPQGGHPGLEEPGRPAHQVHEAPRLGRLLPLGLVETAVDFDRPRRPQARVVGQFLLVASVWRLHGLASLLPGYSALIPRSTRSANAPASSNEPIPTSPRPSVRSRAVRMGSAMSSSQARMSPVRPS